MYISKKFKNWTLKYLSEVDSTMNEIRKEKYKIYKNIVIFCGKQKKGRGRGENEWISEKGNLFASIKTEMRLSNRHYVITYLCGIVVHEVICKYIVNKKDTLIKWPNDILVKKKKIAGILIELSTLGKNIEEVVIGIGINVVSSPETQKYHTTCLSKECDIKDDVGYIMEQILFSLEKWKKYLNKEKRNVQFIIDEWMKRSFELGTTLNIKSDNQIFTGLYRGIAKDGSIRLLINNSIKKFYTSQEVSF